MRKKKAKKRKDNPLELHIEALESFRKEFNSLIAKTLKTMNSTKNNLGLGIQNNMKDISKNLESTKHLFDDIKESDLIKKISNREILDAKDFVLI